MRGTILCLALILCVSCSEQTYKVSRPLLGTIITLTLRGDRPGVLRASTAAFNEIGRIETLMSPHKDGDVSRINNHAGSENIKVSSETVTMLRRSIEAAEDTDGAFDITFASIAHLWDYKKKPFVPPSEEAVRNLLPLVNYKTIKLHEMDNSVSFRYSGTRIGLGGIAKGYAIARAMKVIQEQGVKDAIVDAGGDLLVSGTAGGRLWTAGIKHPRERDVVIILDLYDGEGIATSGDYERFVEYKGKRYQHIIDPRTGYPAEGPVSVSVISRDPVVSDYLATAFMIQDIEWVMKYLKKRKDVAAIIINRDMSVFVSGSLKDRLELIFPVTIRWIE